MNLPMPSVVRFIQEVYLLVYLFMYPVSNRSDDLAVSAQHAAALGPGPSPQGPEPDLMWERLRDSTGILMRA